jgi:hypothetical protein
MSFPGHFLVKMCKSEHLKLKNSPAALKAAALRAAKPELHPVPPVAPTGKNHDYSSHNQKNPDL